MMLPTMRGVIVPQVFIPQDFIAQAFMLKRSLLNKPALYLTAYPSFMWTL
jgi:hypothetical protein